MTHVRHSRCGLLLGVVALCFLASMAQAQDAPAPPPPAIPEAAPPVALAAPPAPTPPAVPDVPAIPDAAPPVALAPPPPPAPTPPPAAAEAPVAPAAQPVPADPAIPPVVSPVVLKDTSIPQISSADLVAEPNVATAESVPPAPPGALVSLFFTAAEREAIAQAKKQFATKATKEESEEDLLDQLQGIKATKKKEQDLQEKYYAQFYLQTLMYHTPEDWTAWVKDSNGTKKYTAATPASADNTLRIIVINKEDATFEWRPKNWPYVMNTFKNDNPSITLDANRQVVIFTLTVNQTMFSYDMQVKEGVIGLTPVVANAPAGAADAKKEEAKKDEATKEDPVEEEAAKEEEAAAKNPLPDNSPAAIKTEPSVMTPAQVKKVTGGILGLYKNLEPVDPRP